MARVVHAIQCIVCPIGCGGEVTVEDGTVTTLTGFTCNKGLAYAAEEVVSPKRMVTTTVRVSGGGLKVSRVVILMRAAKAELRKILHPHTVKVITVDSKPVSGETVRAVSTYFILYVLIAAASVLLVSLDGYDGSTTLTNVYRYPGQVTTAGATPASGSWTGGYEVATPGCLEVRVSSGTASRTVRVGVGAPCPGQPPAPSVDA